MPDSFSNVDVLEDLLRLEPIVVDIYGSPLATTTTAAPVRIQKKSAGLQDLLGEVEVLVEVLEHGDVLAHLVGLDSRQVEFQAYPRGRREAICGLRARAQLLRQRQSNRSWRWSWLSAWPP